MQYLHAQLEEGDVRNGTVTSMEENVSLVTVPSGKVGQAPLSSRPMLPCWSTGKAQGARHVQDGKAKEARLVDVPGHARVANRIFSECVERARSIVFLVDSVDFMSHRVPPLSLPPS